MIYLYFAEFADWGKDGFVKSGKVMNFAASLVITEVDKVRKPKESFLFMGLICIHALSASLQVLHTVTFMNRIPVVVHWRRCFQLELAESLWHRGYLCRTTGFDFSLYSWWEALKWIWQIVFFLFCSSFTILPSSVFWLPH